MKIISKLIVITLGFITLSSCGSLSKENRSSRDLLDGTWELTEVSYGGEGYFKSTMFNDVDAKCFEGSEWFFRSNNSTGYYNIMDPECQTGQRFIRWSIQDANGVPTKFTFKFTDEDRKDLYGGVGFAMDIVSLDPSSMVLKTTVNVEDSPVDLIYQFNKTAALE
ncbi:lipocalin family protein [Robertkochia aurantiaca]|uniref:lipocalin family protein n=1 Tax=Robertkochia aurantiaca TaxID=2873700 RepID=UPI001CCEC28C|nr:lipocalin family protein [Robertkochia sp. 3YJGBD-33]